MSDETGKVVYAKPSVCTCGHILEEHEGDGRFGVCNDCPCDGFEPYVYEGLHVKPTVVCLCGSTRFFDEFQHANYRETMAGRIVLTVGFFVHSPDRVHGEHVGCTDSEKVMLDALHKRKIDLADEILVLNVNGYIGDSTRSEIDYAVIHGKRVRYLESPDVEG